MVSSLMTVLGVAIATTSVDQTDDAVPVAFAIDLTSIQSKTSRQLHGVTIDTFTLMRKINFSEPALLQPAVALSPALLRVGGSAQRSYPVCFGADHPEAANTTCLTRSYWASLCDFARTINTSLIYGLHNDAAGNIDLISGVLANRSACPALAGFSIGNEGVPGSNSTFHAVAAALRASPPPPGFAPLALVGPESPMMSKNEAYFVPLASKLIEQFGDVLSAATFHFCKQPAARCMTRPGLVSTAPIK